MAWVRTRLSAWGLLDASPQRGGFTCLTTRLSSALKSSRVERTTCTLRPDTDITKSWDLAHKTREVISAIQNTYKQVDLLQKYRTLDVRLLNGWYCTLATQSLKLQKPKISHKRHSTWNESVKSVNELFACRLQCNRSREVSKKIA